MARAIDNRRRIAILAAELHNRRRIAILAAELHRDEPRKRVIQCNCWLQCATPLVSGIKQAEISDANTSHFSGPCPSAFVGGKRRDLEPGHANMFRCIPKP